MDTNRYQILDPHLFLVNELEKKRNETSIAITIIITIANNNNDDDDDDDDDDEDENKNRTKLKMNGKKNVVQIPNSSRIISRSIRFACTTSEL